MDKKKTAQTDIETGAKKTEPKSFSTEEFNTQAMGCGKLTLEGETFVIDELKDMTGKNGDFLLIKGHRPNGDGFDLMSSSGKLIKSLKKYWNDIKAHQEAGGQVNISGIGSEFEREYTIKLV
jgi:hypothetical protein